MSDTQQPTEHRFQGTHEGSNGPVKPVEKPEPKAGMLVKIDDGMMKPSTFAEAWDLALVYVKSGMLPKAYTRAEQVVTAMQYAAELGIYGLTALRQIAIINGTPSIFGDLPLAVVRSKGQLEWIKEYYIDRNGKEICSKNSNLAVKPYAAICVTKRKGQPDTAETYFTEDEAKSAGLLGKPGPWSNWYKTMLKMRARSMNLKDSFGDALNGISIAEYDHHLDERTLSENPIQTVTAGGTARPTPASGVVDVQAIFGAANPTEPSGKAWGMDPQVEEAVILEETKKEMPDVPGEFPDAIPGHHPLMGAPKAEVAPAKKRKPKDVPTPSESSPEPSSPESEPPVPLDEPLPDAWVLTFGRYAGKTCQEIPKNELSSFFFQLKNEAKRSPEVPPAMKETIALIDKFLANA